MAKVDFADDKHQKVERCQNQKRVRVADVGVQVATKRRSANHADRKGNLKVGHRNRLHVLQLQHDHGESDRRQIGQA